MHVTALVKGTAYEFLYDNEHTRMEPIYFDVEDHFIGMESVTIFGLEIP